MRRVAAALGGLLLAGCATFSSSLSPSAPPSRIALVIGNAAYESAPALKNPANDATDMCAALRRLNFRTLCHTNLRDRAEFDARVKEYAELLRPGSVGVVFFSGHGAQAANANYLVPTSVGVDAAARNPAATLYGLEALFARLRDRPAFFQLVVLDACRTDLREFQPRNGGGFGLAPISDAPPNTIVFYATAAQGSAYDGSGRNGPVTKGLLTYLGRRGLEVKDMLDEVTKAVRNDTSANYRRPQTPYSYGSFTGEFCFAGCGKPVLLPSM